MLGKMMCRQVPTLPIGGYATGLHNVCWFVSNCVRVSIFLLSTILIYDFGIVPTLDTVVLFGFHLIVYLVPFLMPGIVALLALTYLFWCRGL